MPVDDDGCGERCWWWPIDDGEVSCGQCGGGIGGGGGQWRWLMTVVLMVMGLGSTVADDDY